MPLSSRNLTGPRRKTLINLICAMVAGFLGPMYEGDTVTALNYTFFFTLVVTKLVCLGTLTQILHY